MLSFSVETLSLSQVRALYRSLLPAREFETRVFIHPDDGE